MAQGNQLDFPCSPSEAFSRAAATPEVQAWLDRNPQLTPGPPEPAPRETQAVQSGSCIRTVRAGSGFADVILDPVFSPLEHVFRKLPKDGVYEANRQNPYQFEMGAFTVPRGMAFALAEYNFQIFRLNGAVAGDAVPLEDRRLSLQVGYDMNIDQFRKGDIQIEIVPILPSEVDTQAAQGVVSPPVMDFQAPQVTFPQQSVGGVVLPSVYGPPGAAGTGVTPPTGVVAQTVLSHINASAAGSALMPQESGVQGPSKFPFTYILNANQAVQLKVVVFGPVRIPLAFFEARIMGFLTPKTAMAAMLKGIAPCW